MAAAALPNVFCTMGHGCDLVNENRKTVPEGCKYITSEICGIGSIDLPKILFAFKDPLLKDALQYPDHPKILSVLNEYFKLPAGSPLRVRNAGDSYIDSIITLWADAGNGYFKSGIYQLGNVPEGEIYRNGIPGVMAKNHPREVNHDLYHFIYHGSIWVPPPDGNIQKRYSDIMHERPGIYYHLACRSVCYPNVPNVEHRVELIRQQSANQIRRKGELHQLGPFGQNIRPSIRTKKGAYIQRYIDWSHYVNNELLRDGWQRRINIALAEIAPSSVSLNNNVLPNYVNVPSSVSLNNNVLPNYVNVPSSSSSVAAAQESNSNEESNEESNRDSNEESRNEKNARRQQRIHNRTIRALFRASRANGGRRMRKSYHKKANKRTHKRK